MCELSLDDAGGKPRRLARWVGKRGQLGFFGLATDGMFLYFAWEKGA